MSFWENFHLSSNLLRGGSRTAATSNMEHFVIIVNGWGLLQHPRWSALWYWLTSSSRLLLSQSIPSWMLQDPPLICPCCCVQKICGQGIFIFSFSKTREKKLKSITNNRKTLSLHLKLKKPVSLQFTESLHVVTFDQFWKSYLQFL